MKQEKELRKEIRVAWTALGKDPNQLYLDNKSKEELKEGLTKMKAIKVGFELLLNDSGAENLAIHLLASVFANKEENG